MQVLIDNLARFLILLLILMALTSGIDLSEYPYWMGSGTAENASRQFIVNSRPPDE